METSVEGERNDISSKGPSAVVSLSLPAAVPAVPACDRADRLEPSHHRIKNASPSTFKSASDYVGNLTDRLRYSFQRVREETEKARNRQREQYNKRAKEKNYVVDIVTRVVLEQE
ncbi:hypothetical protein OUZ56_026439 [Daphnia magna]|uniref:Uncharacterized protein n=1 Tax=Daphnia magna TaxID=35525 RepID=A0ABQ9ZLU6_9CRUS|nr:hypothetical protein OUZ56_026439 [Daphnia magna]